MDKKEMKEKFSELYIKMAASTNVENMKLFGSVMEKMMEELISNNPEKAEKFLEQLEAVKWKNYLTQSEAEKILERMEPEAPWKFDKWKNAMEEYGYSLEEWPYYNKGAIYVTMNMIMSDSGQTIPKYISSNVLFKFVHDMAVDKLKDKDGVFSVRKYFGL